MRGLTISKNAVINLMESIHNPQNQFRSQILIESYEGKLKNVDISELISKYNPIVNNEENNGNRNNNNHNNNHHNNNNYYNQYPNYSALNPNNPMNSIVNRNVTPQILKKDTSNVTSQQNTNIHTLSNLPSTEPTRRHKEPKQQQQQFHQTPRSNYQQRHR